MQGPAWSWRPFMAAFLCLTSPLRQPAAKKWRRKCQNLSLNYMIDINSIGTRTHARFTNFTKIKQSLFTKNVLCWCKIRNFRGLDITVCGAPRFSLTLRNLGKNRGYRFPRRGYAKSSLNSDMLANMLSAWPITRIFAGLAGWLAWLAWLAGQVLIKYSIKYLIK